MKLLTAEPGIEVVAAVDRAESAFIRGETLKPDVLLCSFPGQGARNAEVIERLSCAFSAGLVVLAESVGTSVSGVLTGATPEYVIKPKSSRSEDVGTIGRELVRKIRSAARTGIKSQADKGVQEPPLPTRPAPLATERRNAQGKTVGNGSTAASGPVSAGDRVIFIGASTGGTEAIRTVLSGLTPQVPPALVVQHMPEAFTKSFAARLDACCPMRVIEAEDGMALQRGTAYVAPGHSHLRVCRDGNRLLVRLSAEPPFNRHRPSVDVLFHSAAEVVGNRALGVILTGMGKDGAEGLLAMRRAGAHTFGQDEKSCVVYGMPREAFLIGAVGEQLPLGEISRRMLSCLSAG